MLINENFKITKTFLSLTLMMDFDIVDHDVTAQMTFRARVIFVEVYRMRRQKVFKQT